MRTLAFVGTLLKITEATGEVNAHRFYKYYPNSARTGLVFECKKEMISIPFADSSTDGVTAFANLAAQIAWVESAISGAGNVGGFTNVVGVEVTRPANATAYAALDAIADSTSAPTVISFANIAKVVGGTGYITKLRAMTDKKDFTARIRLHLYNTAPTAINDNDPFLLLYANKDKRIGHIDLAAFSTEDPTNSTGARSQNYDVRLAFALASGSKTIYAMAEILDAATPASGQKFYFELTAENNG